MYLKPHYNFLEIGCGRGKICIFHSKNGGRAKGVDYSTAAIALAQRKARELAVNPSFHVLPFSAIVEKNCTYDRILASEFIEHISQSEGEQFFKIVYAALKPQGKLLIYTMPNTLQRKFGYPIVKILAFFRGISLPKQQEDTLSEHYLKYHLNEQSYFKLRKSVQSAGFGKFVIGYDFNAEIGKTKFRRFFWGLIKQSPLRHIFLTDLFLLAEK